MKKTYTLMAAMIISSAIFAQRETQERNLEPFFQIEIVGAVHVNLKQGLEQSVKVTADQAVMNNVKTIVKGGTLKIDQSGNKKGSVKIDVTVTSLSKITQQGVSVINTKGGTIKSEKLEIELSGASAADLDIDVKTLVTTIKGAGCIELSGNADEHHLTISGAGAVSARHLNTASTNLTMSGAGSAELNAVRSLTGSVSGAGVVTYQLKPEILDVSTSSVASVVKQADGSGELKAGKLKVRELNNDILINVPDSTISDTTRFRLGVFNIILIRDEAKAKEDTTKAKKQIAYSRKAKWAGIDLGVAGYLSPQQSLGMQFEHRDFELDYARSRTWNINFLEKNLKLYRHNIGVVTGLGTSFTRYHFYNRQTVVNPYADSTFISPMALITRKHFLSTMFLTAPLLLEFNTHRNPSKSLHFAAGVVGGYRLGSRNVQLVEVFGRRARNSTRDDFNINPFNLSATARFGHGNLTFFATYSLTELFVTGRGPELYPFTAGIRLFGF
jgi:hypothetical protein